MSGYLGAQYEQASQTVAVKQSDRAPQLIAEAKSSFARVKDYMGTLVKEERVNGRPQPEGDGGGGSFVVNRVIVTPEAQEEIARRVEVELEKRLTALSAPSVDRLPK